MATSKSVFPRIVRLLSLGSLAIVCTQAFAQQTRTIVPLAEDWRFHQGKLDTAFPAAGDDRTWQTVTVPHSWSNAEAIPGKDFYAGDSWYSRRIAFNPAWKDKRVFLKFEAVSLIAEVFLNGKRVGEHHGGFAAFVYELTNQLNPTGENVLVVRVNNKRRDDVSPLGGDFTIFGGIYRPVSLIVTGQTDITPLDYGSPGVFLKQQQVSPVEAQVEATTEVSNGSTKAMPVTVQYRVVDATGHKVLARIAEASIAPGSTQKVVQSLTLPHPHLWNGVSDPYLYKVEVHLLSAGKLIDSVDQPLGLRFMKVDPQQGLVLNGAKPMQIHGVCLHQEYDGHGWAVTPAEEANDIRLMREMGVNGVRLVHYQHSQTFLDQADRAGLLVWAELTQVDHVSASPEYHENIRQQLLELIRQNYNHPSIFVWSLYNELNSPTKLISTPLIEELNVLAHQEDPTRPTTGADSGDTIANQHEMVASLDLISTNFYPGWYGRRPDAMDADITKWNNLYDRRGLSVSEYGGGASVIQHKQNVGPGEVKPNGRFHPEEWQADVHEGNYKAIASHPEVWGSFAWVMFDFASNGRHEGDTDGVNDKGLVTRDRLIRKDSYFYYQAQWAAKPMVYVTSRRDTERTSAITDVKIYSNQPAVSLSINGKDQGKGEQAQPGVFLWHALTLAAGANRIQARTPGATDECEWTLKPASSAEPAPAR